ncbi:MAG: DUF4013 domain-containing protein [Planctomycetes bacterium]|nr:DUF4013 domain-containing protein [Planctomycetota bacterium]
MTACPFCSEPIEAGAAKCPHCGETLVERPRQAPEDLSQVFSWMFEDPQWVLKLVIGTACMLFSCLLLPMLAVTGYKLRIARQQARAPGTTPMPEWDDPGTLVLDGLRALVSFLSLASLLFLGLGLLVGVGVLLDLASAGQVGPFTAIFGVAAYAGVIGGSLGITVLVPAIELELIETRSFFASLHVRSLWRRVATRPGDYLLLFIYHVVTNMIGGALAFLLYAPVTWAMYTQGALLGRYLAQQRAKDAALGLVE